MAEEYFLSHIPVQMLLYLLHIRRIVLGNSDMDHLLFPHLPAVFFRLSESAGMSIQRPDFWGGSCRAYMKNATLLPQKVWRFSFGRDWVDQPGIIVPYSGSLRKPPGRIAPAGGGHPPGRDFLWEYHKK